MREIMIYALVWGVFFLLANAAFRKHARKYGCSELDFKASHKSTVWYQK